MPGVQLGPDGKPCGVCDEFKTWTHKTKPKSKNDDASSQSTPPPAATATSADAKPAIWGEYEPVTPCPPDSIELGNHTWTFLHTTAAHYPTQPTAAQQSAMSGLVSSVAALYPCGWCATHLTDYLVKRPPATESRDAISQWMCVMHNDVNRRLGKPEFDCSRVLERWKESMDRARCGGNGH
ncbi:FAD dependent sulfhydryl oxidase [Blastocladiella britannica]|nr:FAD dependent sulfhydryl oxidase [Blastocladiella britannica]